MYDLDIKPSADRIFAKMSKKNQARVMKINKKILAIRNNPTHNYKFLKKPLQTFNRAHIDNHFVLIFQIDHKEKVVEIYYFDHHDNV